jgi:hypothetical protein
VTAGPVFIGLSPFGVGGDLAVRDADGSLLAVDRNAFSWPGEHSPGRALIAASRFRADHRGFVRRIPESVSPSVFSGEEGRAALRSFVADLPANVRRSLDATGLDPSETDPAVLNWVSGFHIDGIDSEETPTEALRDIRVQAAVSYPLLPYIVAQDPLEDRSVRLTRAVDAQEPLAPVLQQSLGVPRWVVRRMVGLRPQHLTAGHASSPVPVATCLSRLRNLPPDLAPRTPDAWDVYRSLLQIAIACYSTRSGHPLIEWLDRIVESGMRWHRQGASPYVFTAVAVGELVDDAARNLLPAFPIGRARTDGYVDRLAIAILFPVPSASAIVETHALWRRRRAGMMADLSARFPLPGGGRLVWTAVVNGSWTSPEGWVVTEIADEASLRDEGARMLNCLGGYVDRCMAGEVHVLRVTSPDGKSASNALIRIGQDDEGIVVIDHKGVANGPVGHPAMEAVAQWIRSAEQRRRDPARSIRHTRFQSKAPLVRPAVFDIFAEGVRERLIEHWSPIVPKAFRERMLTILNLPV